MHDNKNNKKKILILVKEKVVSSEYGYFSTGLFTSATFIKNALKHYMHLHVDVEKAIDGNDIDRRVHKHRPDICIIEAIWVTPSKMLELAILHPKVQWVIRIHSKTPFLANEGNAIDWIREYNEIDFVTGNVKVGFNAKETYEEFKKQHIHSIYLPNFYYPSKENHKCIEHKCFDDRHGIHVACFGALRPMKNHLIQAMAAIEYADSIGKKLYFHINGTRAEQRGEQVLKNIIALFEDTKHELVSWPWLSHEDFCSLIKRIDIGMQVSLSESFNIVTGDFVDNNVPIVVSDEIEWMPFFTKASVSNTKSIVKKLALAHNLRSLFTFVSKIFLAKHNLNAYEAWKKYLEHSHRK